MKISSIKNISPVLIQKKFSEKSKESYKNDFSFSRNCSNILKAYNLSFRGLPSEAEYQQKCNEIRIALLEDGKTQEEVNEILSKIKRFNCVAAAKIAQDENQEFKEYKTQAILALNPYNCDLAIELLEDKDFPRGNFLCLLNHAENRKNANAIQSFYRYLSKNPDNPKADIEDALTLINAENKSFLKEFYQFFEQDGRLNLKQVNSAFGTLTWEYVAQEKIEAYKAIVAQEDFTSDELSKIIKHTSVGSSYTKIGLEFLKEYLNYPQELKVFLLADVASLSAVHSSCDREDFYNGAKEFGVVYKKLMTNPELYINGEADSKEEAQDEINDFIETEFESLVILSNLLKQNAMEQLFRKRIDAVSDFIYKYDKLDYDYASLLEKLLNLKNIDGSEFSPNERLSLIDSICAFNACNTKISKIKEKIKDGKIDLEELKRFLLNETFLFCEMTQDEIDKIPKEKLEKWNLEYIPFIAILKQQMETQENDDTLNQLIKLANSDVDFKTLISDDNEYGSVNWVTKELFTKNGLDYNKWLNPPKNLEVQFKYIDSNEERLAQVVSQVEEDIEVLRKTPAKSFIDKHFSDCIIGKKFKINEKYCKNKQTLSTFTKNMFRLLDRNIFSRAQANLENPDKKKNAQITLTIKNHLEQRLKDISACEIKKKEKPVDLTIKMWDRDPIYDLFQGSYSTCCISLDGENSSAMPHYLLNTAFNMIELIDNSTGKTIGNALCYFITNEFDEPIFVIDNIEIANKHKMSDKASDELLNKITGYCINLCREISNRNIQIVMGTSYNDVYDEELYAIELEKANLLGEIDCEEIYMDVFDGWDDGKYYFDKTKDEDKMEVFYLADSWQGEVFDNENIDDWC